MLSPHVICMHSLQCMLCFALCHRVDFQLFMIRHSALLVCFRLWILWLLVCRVSCFRECMNIHTALKHLFSFILHLPLHWTQVPFLQGFQHAPCVLQDSFRLEVLVSQYCITCSQPFQFAKDTWLFVLVWLMIHAGLSLSSRQSCMIDFLERT